MILFWFENQVINEFLIQSLHKKRERKRKREGRERKWEEVRKIEEILFKWPRRFLAWTNSWVSYRLLRNLLNIELFVLQAWSTVKAELPGRSSYSRFRIFSTSRIPRSILLITQWFPAYDIFSAGSIGFCRSLAVHYQLDGWKTKLYQIHNQYWIKIWLKMDPSLATF
jgi:hypothetical protein